MPKRMTPELAAEIKRLAAETDLHQHQIAALVGVNQGRVSEVLRGKRFADVSGVAPDDLFAASQVVKPAKPSHKQPTIGSDDGSISSPPA